MDQNDERSYYRAMFVISVVLGVLTLVVGVAVAIVGRDDPPSGPPEPTQTSTPTPTPGATAPPPASKEPPDLGLAPSDTAARPPREVAGRSAVPEWMSLPEAPEACPPPTMQVADADDLRTALAAAKPGSVIYLADGVYKGRFRATTAATASNPVWLCGSPRAVLDGGGPQRGNTLHLAGASHWRVQGLTVRGGQKGVMADRVTGVMLRGLTVHSVGDEAIHLRQHSSENVVTGNVISDTGLRTPEFGEGVYVGSSHTNWCTLTDCEPDAGDRNEILDNVVFATTAEPVDIKEGTADGTVAGNQLDGAAMGGDVPESWVAVKGNGWRVVANEGRHSPSYGFQVARVGPDGWGRDNTVAENTGRLDDDDGVLVTAADGNTVACSNTLRGAGTATDGECVAAS